MPTRRTFVKQLAASSLASAAIPTLHSFAQAPKAVADLPLVGLGDYQYRCNHTWAQLPNEFTWQTTHNVAVDSQGLVYVIHEGRLDQPDHPAIFVFDAEGKFVRAFGQQFQGGGHGLEVHQEGSDEFLYVTAYQQQRSFAKLTLTGDVVWHKFAPMETGLYADGEDKVPRRADDNPWGRDRFHPTNYAFHPDGGFYLADGYGSFAIHHYDAEGNYQSSFGKPSDDADADGTFDTPHGIWIDDRQSERLDADGVAPEPLVVVADRANSRLQWLTLSGEHRRTQDGFLLPANIDRRGQLLLVPDLIGRVTLLDSANEVISHLGDDSARITADKPDGRERRNWTIRSDESKWLPGKFVHPHDACFDADGDIFVTEWVERGRVTKMTRVV
jgi:hypothetical protein